MLFLLLSIFCSVSVGIIFKISRKYNIAIAQVVMWNYVFALLLCFLFFSPDVSTINNDAPWGIYLPLMVLLPSVFILLAASIKHIGIVKTDAAQRLSLFIPILAAWFIFKEEFNLLKLAGLGIGFPAILMILSKKDEHKNNNWIYPAIVLIGFGIIDVLFKQIALYTTLPYTTSLFVVFGGSLISITLYVAFEVIFKSVKFNIMNLAFGALVGIFNFGNILFYLKAHKVFAENPSTVFAAMNMGVIVTGSLAGIFIFKEKLSKLNYFGLFMALLAIVFITLSQIYK
ncbi:EamA family transporter [Flavobacterium sp. NRK1]|uniref:EamA family transporter n=1 Tax=Flavobacterium sp. NRK1 TaxID=2954929 RepID=UPI00209274EA|nr:EamA family transporter [Flavobacterium sp. NRK1]MCO6149631.1 EamA family transporter [Flavobacterium sp. NRK1]